MTDSDTHGDGDGAASASEPPSESTSGPTPDADGAAPRTRQTRHVGRLSRRLARFATAHGGTAEGQVSYLGARGYRLVLVGSDGAWGDVVDPRREALTEAAERAGIALREDFDGELSGRVRTGPYEWRRMAGSQLGAGGTRPGSAAA
ncbi:hypothetical protein ACTWP5_23415 [Streptomyces sp. 4N509B]|uniref:hypothetical protein n=1 Tax=Streptomyces sp. 4N509B TaxID=3457413 RepID=UPI003FD19FD7